MGKEQELLDAARSGNIALIEKILSQRKWTAGPLALPLPSLPTIRKGVHPNCQDTNGETPLHHASLNGHKEVVELLLKLQASANIPDQKGCYPLHLSAWRGNADVCRVLLNHGPSIAKVNAKNLEGDTALHSAAQYGHNQVVDLLLQNNADPTIRNNKGEKALDLAIQYGRLETVQLLLHANKTKILELAPDDKTPLFLAAKNGHRQVLQVLLDAGFNVNDTSSTGTVLHEACMYGRLEIVKLLLEKGVDVSIKDGEEKTAVDLLQDLNTPISLEILKAIDDHVNGAKTGMKAHRLSSELDYDYPPVSSRPVIESCRDRLQGEDGSSAEAEESIYDHPRAFQGVLKGKNASAKKDLPLKSPDTPKKPPRKRLPQSVLIKSRKEQGDDTDTMSSSGSINIAATCIMTTSDTSASVASSLGDGKSTNTVPVAATVTMAATVTNCEYVNNNKANCTNNNDKTSGATKNEDAMIDGKNKRESSEGKSTNQLPANQRPPSLDLNGSKQSLCKDIPLSPSNYEQPPTPEHPPPSPMTALLGIQERINPKERRRSRDMETITETEYLAAMATDSASSSTENPNASVPVSATAASSRLCPSSEGCGVAVTANKNPYHGLMMGSLSGGQRRIKSQILDSIYSQGPKRSSIPLFDPLPERSEEPGSSFPPPQASHAGPPSILQDGCNRASQRVKEKREKVTTPDETEEWAKIEDLITSFGGGLDTDMLVKEFDERMSNMLITTGGLRIQSVGDWLESLDLPQYENLLIANGFDDIDFLGPDVLEKIDLEEIGVVDETHQLKILESASKFPTMKPFDDTQHSVKEWLESIRLSIYLDTLTKHGFYDLERIRKLWEVELTSILDISMLGHRKRILASLKHSPHAEKREKFLQDNETAQILRDLTPSEEKKTVNLFKDYTHLISLQRTAAAKQSLFDQANPGQSDERTNSGVGKEEDKEEDGCEAIEAAVSHWCHRPEALIKGCCNYNVQYLGSTLVTQLDGTESTKASISKFKRSTENIAKVPNIILSISYCGVKFIDAKSKRVICEHEIGNIFCACQDGDSLNFFAYITRDLESDRHYCHVFTVDSTPLATEIILTLGEAFEVAYQIAVTERNQRPRDSHLDVVFQEDEMSEIHELVADSLERLPASVNASSYSTAI